MRRLVRSPVHSPVPSVVHSTLGEGGGVTKQFVILGASIEVATFTDLPAFKAAIVSAHGVSGFNVYNEAVSGWTASDLDTNLNTILARYSPAIQTYFFIHIAGNDVTNNRPYSTDTHLAALTASLASIKSKIETWGGTPVFADLSFRNYDGTTFAAEQNGSRPYNINIIRPLVGAGWKHASGKPFIQLYDLTRNNYLTYLDVGDPVHINTVGQAAYRQHLIDTLFKKALTGVSPTELTATNSTTVKLHTHSLGGGEPTGWTYVATNALASTSIVDFATSHSTGWNAVVTDTFDGAGNTGMTTGANTGVYPDTVLLNFAFVDNTLTGQGAFKITGLDDSRVYDLTMAGSRNTTGSRLTKFTINGNAAGAQQLETVLNTANVVSFSGVSPVSGEITVLVDRVNHQFGYINGFTLTQRAA